MNAPSVKFGENLFLGEFVNIGSPPNDASCEGKSALVSKSDKIDRISWKSVILGSDVIIRDYVNIDLGINNPTEVRNNVYIHSKASIYHDTIIDKNVVIGPNACICGSVFIAENSQVGAMASIHQNLYVGKYSMIGMGAVIVKDVPPFVIVAGVPGRIINLNMKKLTLIFSQHEIQTYFGTYLESCINSTVEAYLERDASLPLIIKNATKEFLSRKNRF